MKAFLPIVLLVALGCGGSGTTTEGVATSQPTAEPTQAVVQRETLTVKGKGISSSKAFRLAGNYELQWVATADSSVGCYHGATLKRADGTFMFETIANEMIDSKKPVSGETNLFNLDDAEYYVDASSGCDWEFTFVPN
jgi:hypothetical protein